MNTYRSIGGRLNASGTERVDRDGKIEVVKPCDIEVTPLDRMSWYNKAKIDTRGNVPEEIFGADQDISSGTSMNVTVDKRTSQPKPRQFSTEARLVEQRGEKVEFPIATNTRDAAVGIMAGAILPDRGVESRDKKEEENNKKASMSTDSVRFKTASAFEKIARLTKAGKIDTKSLVEIGEITGLPVREIFVLEKVAQDNPDLVDQYADVRDPKESKKRILRKKKNTCPGNIPGNTESPGCIIEKESDDEEEDKLKATALEVGLVE